MPTIYGKYKACDVEVESCECDYKYCEHTSDILKRYGSPVYGSYSILSQIIKILLDYQEASAEAICSATIDLKPSLSMLGFNYCYWNSSPADCITICENNYQTHEADESCGASCEELELSQEDIDNIFLMIPYLKYPSRMNIQAICDIFGWVVIYTNDYINIYINGDDPNFYKSIIDLIPIPIGEEIRILTDC
ncbi:hypothetical protein N9043_00730 [bacterium]|nr:hypothetical protein [bacterium]